RSDVRSSGTARVTATARGLVASYLAPTGLGNGLAPDRGVGGHPSADRPQLPEVREHGRVTHEEGDRDEAADAPDHDRDDWLEEVPQIPDDELDLLIVLVGDHPHQLREAARLLAGIEKRRDVGGEAIRELDAGAEGLPLDDGVARPVDGPSHRDQEER